MTIFSCVDADGVLNVSVPVGATDANCPVQVTIEPTTPAKASEMGYIEWLEGLAGQWQGEFVRGDEGAFESRELLP